MKKRRIAAIALVFAMLFNVSAFAATVPESTMSIDEARAYLTNYKATELNYSGEEFSVQYSFDSEENLEKAAAYISEYGLDQFLSESDKAVEEVVAKEPPRIQPLSTTPTTAYTTVYGNGSHRVSASGYGLAEFGKYGTLEYKPELAYTAVVSNGEFTRIDNISFDITYIDVSGSWGGLSLPSDVYWNSCSVTANYTITKSVSIGVGDFSYDVVLGTDLDIFGLIAHLG